MLEKLYFLKILLYKQHRKNNNKIVLKTKSDFFLVIKMTFDLNFCIFNKIKRIRDEFVK